eukprot:COSAG02_NODE_4547_length_5227_cov_54.893721_5_plen_91_part_00
MASHNSVNGRPCHSSSWLLTDVFRKELGCEKCFIGTGRLLLLPLLPLLLLLLLLPPPPPPLPMLLLQTGILSETSVVPVQTFVTSSCCQT